VLCEEHAAAEQRAGRGHLFRDEAGADGYRGQVFPVRRDELDAAPDGGAEVVKRWVQIDREDKVVHVVIPEGWTASVLAADSGCRVEASQSGPWLVDVRAIRVAPRPRIVTDLEPREGAEG